MTLTNLVLEKSSQPAGKQKLIEAALRLCARDGTALSSLGLRELAREAGLNHNTFYRHFTTIEDLAKAAASEIAEQIMVGMKDVRQRSQKHDDATRGAAEYFLDFVERSPEAFLVALRELHGGSQEMRAIFRAVIDYIAAESVEQITSMKLAPGLRADALLPITTAITYYMLYRSLDSIDHPEQREQIISEMVNFIRAQFFGAMALQNMRSAHPGPPT
jgi:AcrR family transcriptional regulator